MTFLESLKTCLIHKYFTFSGRASRSEYWWFFIFYCISFLAFQSIFLKEPQFSLVDQENAFFSVMLYHHFLFFFPFVTVTWRRFHDVSLSGWWSLLGGIPFIGQVLFLYATIIKGSTGPNRFGEDPLQTPHSMNTETESVADTNHPAPAGHPSVGGEK